MSKETAERIFELLGIVTFGLVCPIFVPLADKLFSASDTGGCETSQVKKE